MLPPREHSDAPIIATSPRKPLLYKVFRGLGVHSPDGDTSDATRGAQRLTHL
jgi:hypothetical protein